LTVEAASTDLRSVWLHVHVPKAGGSTLRQLMNRSFGKGFYNSTSLYEVKQYTREEVSEIVRCHSWLKGFSDHKLSFDLPFDSIHANVFALAYVRNPLERFISRYFFHRHFEEVNCIAQRLSFSDFAKSELEENNCHPQTNSQIYFLNGGRSFTDMQIIETALATKKACLFPIERFDESCICLEQLFPVTFEDLSYVPANVSKKDAEISQSEREYVAGFLAQDNPVFDRANQFLDELLKSTFASLEDRQAALADFQDRCSRRFHNFFPPVEKGEPVPPIGTIPPPTAPEPVDPRYKHLAKPTLDTRPSESTRLGG
jgi:hypothetical protein